MNTKWPMALALCLCGIMRLGAQGTALTYQGRLLDQGSSANGLYAMEFGLWDALSGGTRVAGPITNSSVAVSNGVFLVTIDFGNGAFNGNPRWLEIGVRSNGSAVAFGVLIPRQSFMAVPYAILAGNISGMVPDAQLSPNIPRLNANQNFTGNITFAPPSGAPFLVGNTNRVTNLNADLLDGFDSGAFWKGFGNAGTLPGSNFVGTTDNQPLELKVNNQRGLRLEPTPSAETVNVIGGSARNSTGPGVVGATIGGGGAGNYFGLAYTNRVEANFGTVSGGRQNTIQTPALYAEDGANDATIGGGFQNTIQLFANASTIGGGSANTITNAPYSTIAGGARNEIQPVANAATIGGGYLNGIQPYADYATIGGGYLNIIQTNADSATIGGGEQNLILPNASYAIIPGGQLNSATNYAFAAGRRAKANHTGAFVWADSTDANLASTASNQFLIRAQNGVGINLNNPSAALDVNGKVKMTQFQLGSSATAGQILTADTAGVGTWQPPVFTADVTIANPGDLNFGAATRQMINLFNGNYGLGVQNNTLYQRSDGGFAWFQHGVHNNNQNNPGTGGTNLMSLDAGGNLALNAGLTLDVVNANNGSYYPGLVFGSGSGETIASQRGTNGSNRYGIDFYTGFSPRLSIANNGNIGIGTATPQGKLDINTGVGSVQVRNDSGLVPGINVTGGGIPGVLRLRNSLEVWPSQDATRSGKIDVRDTNGNATISLDGQTGKIAAKNLPFVVYTNSWDNGGIGEGTPCLQDFTICEITVNLPVAGILVMSGHVTYAGVGRAGGCGPDEYPLDLPWPLPKTRAESMAGRIGVGLEHVNNPNGVTQLSASGRELLPDTFTGVGVARLDVSSTLTFQPGPVVLRLRGDNSTELSIKGRNLTAMFFPTP